MTIIVPPEVETSINAAVQSGYFASVDDAMTEAARLLLQQLHQRQASSQQPATASDQPSPTAHKPIWEEIEEITAGIPDEEFLKLPRDGASQHDHYIYGTPKRPVAQ
jgi:Arc/MetJ-type ribon-helix-helix transcriptional regulator